MHTISSTWPELLGQFFQNFTQPGAEIFFRLMTGWVLCPCRRTLTGLLRFADPWAKRAPDAYHRFLPDARWRMAELWKWLAKIRIQAFCRNGIIPRLSRWLYSTVWLWYLKQKSRRRYFIVQPG